MATVTTNQMPAIGSEANSRTKLVAEGEKSNASEVKAQITKNDQIVFKGNKVFLADKAD